MLARLHEADIDARQAIDSKLLTPGCSTPNVNPSDELRDKPPWAIGILRSGVSVVPVST